MPRKDAQLPFLRRQSLSLWQRSCKTFNTPVTDGNRILYPLIAIFDFRILYTNVLKTIKYFIYIISCHASTMSIRLANTTIAPSVTAIVIPFFEPSAEAALSGRSLAFLKAVTIGL